MDTKDALIKTDTLTPLPMGGMQLVDPVRIRFAGRRRETFDLLHQRTAFRLHSRAYTLRAVQHHAGPAEKLLRL